MPLYEYHCKKCDTQFERLRPASARGEATSCPSGHVGARPLLSLVASVSTMTRPIARDREEQPRAGGCACGGAGCGH
ncbi:MAG TPA: zinc ribbon domain-containing protein [Dehalococcoidia bacterium]|nr:zinc ribbon domain-containing protein [Dehalococcoidia bacterium]